MTQTTPQQPDDGGAAFPELTREFAGATKGMTKREFYAAHAMSGLIASKGDSFYNRTERGAIIQNSLAFADLMVAAFSTTPAVKKEGE